MLAGACTSFFVSILSLVLVSMSVAFFTLLERKLLGLGQNRKSVNKNSLFGFLQPLVDALKLFSKHLVIPGNVVVSFFLFFPVVNLILFFCFWMSSFKMLIVFPFWIYFLAILSISSLTGLAIVISGWSSSSSYSLLGSIRGLVQFLTYEVVFSLGVVVIFSLVFSFSSLMAESVFCLLFVLLLAYLLFVVLMESHRSPFDFAEGESELVSGFNTDYSSVYFSLIFLSEYGLLLFMIYFVLFPFYMMSFYLFLLVGVIGMLFILIRAVSPRLRIDIFQKTVWLVLLPILILLFGISLIWV